MNRLGRFVFGVMIVVGAALITVAGIGVALLIVINTI